MTGTLYCFDAKKGFGFIVSPDFPHRIFVHITNVLNPDAIAVGARVEVNSVSESRKGWRAFGVHVLTD